MLKYNFLMLCLLFWIPAVLAYVSRPDLRRAMRLAALCSLPFAFSEFLFYPDYWTPTFLFDLGDRLGFGIEDFLFVSALAANAVSIYGVLSSRTYAPQDAQVSPGTPLKRIASILTLVLVLVGPVPVKLLVVFLYFTGLGFFCFIGWPWPGSLKTCLLVAYPLLATTLMALLIKDGPAGHWRCNAFVALAVSSVVATMATLAGDLLLCRSEGQRLFG